MPPKLLKTIEPVLRRTPATLRALLTDLDPALVERPYGPNTWSAKEILAHLIYGERTDWLPRTRHILAHNDAIPFDPFDRAGHARLFRAHTLGELLDLFDRERTAGLRELAQLNLTESDLARRGLHPALGPVTLGNLLATWAAHDLNHIAQISKAMAFQLKGDVGAWENYLSILAPPRPR